jgi:phage shock protein PspC (stress-responsive transcriptional regulator)
MFPGIIGDIVSWFEQQTFGVCAWLGNKLGMQGTTIRLYFIYLSFFTFGSPIIIYFILAFLLENKKYFSRSSASHVRRRTWDL